MADRLVECDVCGKFFVEVHEVAAHRERSTSCEPEVSSENIDPNRPNLPNTSCSARNENLTEIKGYSLNYITLPENFFENLENERPCLDGRFQSVIDFARAVTAEQHSDKNIIKRNIFEAMQFAMETSVCLLRYLGILSLIVAFLYCCGGKSSSKVTYFAMDNFEENK